MIKKLIPLLFLIPAISVAGDSYDPATGTVHMPTVIVGTENYGVNMLHQGNLVFQVTSATPLTFTSNAFDTYDSATGILHMPFVTIGSDIFEVDMLHQGNLVFNVTSATKVDFKFTTEYLKGKTLYSVSYEDGEWEIIGFTYSDSTLSIFVTNNPKERADNVPYTVTEQGYISSFWQNSDGSDKEAYYLRATIGSSDYLNLAWNEELGGLSNKTPDNDDFFFFDLQKAQDFVDSKNAEIK